MPENQYNIEKVNSRIFANMKDDSVNVLKLLDVYLNRINAKNPDTMLVQFTKKEFCELMGLHPNSEMASIKDALKKLKQAEVSFDIETEYGRGIRTAVLFTLSDIIPGQGRQCTIIRVKCNPIISHMFFDLKENDYTRYMLKNTIRMQSGHSIRLYTRLKMDIFRGNPVILTTKELCKMFDYSRSKLATEGFKPIHRILRLCVEEINECTDITIEITPAAQKKIIEKVAFHIHEKTVTDEGAFIRQQEQEKEGSPYDPPVNESYDDNYLPFDTSVEDDCTEELPFN